MVIFMKKTVLWVLAALISGAILGKVTFDKYEKIDVQSVISFNNKVYMLRYGNYSNLDEMYEKVTNVDRYIYIEKEDGVSAYVGTLQKISTPWALWETAPVSTLLWRPASTLPISLFQSPLLTN